jgi:hypothetical protein
MPIWRIIAPRRTQHVVGTKFSSSPGLPDMQCSACKQSYIVTNGLFLCRDWTSLLATLPRGRNGTPAAKSPTSTPFQHKLQPVNPIPASCPSRNPLPNFLTSVARNRYNPADRICRNLSRRLVPKLAESVPHSLEEKAPTVPIVYRPARPAQETGMDQIAR